MTTPGQPPPVPLRPYYLLPGTQVGTYAICEAIGKGGGQMAYLADSPDGRQVVLKISLFPKGEEGSLNRKMHDRFMRQVGFFITLHGTMAVADIFGHGMFPDQSESSHAYLIQEWIPGSVNIIEWYRAKPHKLTAIIGGWIALANACAEMTRRGICHRDLKPENILVNPDGLPKIVDLDSGRNIGANPLTTEVGGWPGTKRYYSPELCRAYLSGSVPSYKTPFQSLTAGDLHALGVVFYQVLTGKYPFDEGEDDEDLLKQIAYKVPERPRVLNREVPFGLEKITMKLLQKDPDRRYQYGDKVVADLEALLSTGENWLRLFQTPAREQGSASASSRPPTSRTRASSPSTPRSRVGSAALNLVPSAIEPTPSTLAALARPEVAHPEPVPRSPLPRRRALLLAVALAMALVVPWIFLGQHGAAGPISERGTMWLGKARTAIVAVASMAVSACVGLTGNVRPSDLEFVAKCPPESRKAVNELGLEPDIGMAVILEGPNVIVPEGGGVELRDGPVEVSAALPAVGGAVVARLFGTIKTTPDAAFIQFTKFKQFQEGDPEDGPPSGPSVDICAYASIRDYPFDPGIPKADNPPPASELHSGFLLVTNRGVGVHFAH